MVSRAGDGILLTWNTQAARDAQAGQVVITDGDKAPEAVFLGSDELRNGKIFYRAQSSRLRFRVDLIDGANRQLSDSVLVLDGPEQARQPAYQPRPRPVTPPPGNIDRGGSHSSGERHDGRIVRHIETGDTRSARRIVQRQLMLRSSFRRPDHQTRRLNGRPN